MDHPTAPCATGCTISSDGIAHDLETLRREQRDVAYMILHNDKEGVVAWARGLEVTFPVGSDYPLLNVSDASKLAGENATLRRERDELRAALQRLEAASLGAMQMINRAGDKHEQNWPSVADWAKARQELHEARGQARAVLASTRRSKAMKPCIHLDYTEGKYGPDITLETCAPHYPAVRYWRRGETWTNNGPDEPPNPSQVQFCKLRGRINSIFECYLGEFSCYEGAKE